MENEGNLQGGALSEVVQNLLKGGRRSKAQILRNLAAG